MLIECCWVPVWPLSGVDDCACSPVCCCPSGRSSVANLIPKSDTSSLSQLFYLNRALRLVGPTLICPLAFCFYNLSSMISGLIYYDQLDALSSLQIGLVTLGTVILLAGVWIVSLRAEASKQKDSAAKPLLPGPGAYSEEPESDGDEESERSCDHVAPGEWLPRGLSIGISATSPG